MLRRKRVWIPILVVATLFLAATARLFLWPTTNDVRRADAVVVLDGGDGERLHKGRELMARHVAPTLVVSVGRELDSDEANGLCANRQGFEVVCFVPKPADTRGEARAFAVLARRHHWDTAVLVTSTYHVTRARALFERCYDGHLDAVTATPPRRPLEWAANVAHEWVGTIEATFVRKC
jgi:uncharacterized SAM-binding protein YcdF (DUF218 family)